MLNPNPQHPGRILAERFLSPLRLAASPLAVELRLQPNRMTELVAGKRNITVDTALRLARYFGNRPEEWMTWQMEWDIAQARKAGIEDRVKDDVRPRAARDLAA